MIFSQMILMLKLSKWIKPMMVIKPNLTVSMIDIIGSSLFWVGIELLIHINNVNFQGLNYIYPNIFIWLFKVEAQKDWPMLVHIVQSINKNVSIIIKRKI